MRSYPSEKYKTPMFKTLVCVTLRQSASNWIQKMKFAGALVPLLVSLSDIAAAVNNFKGLTVSNSIGGATTYTCRTQAQVSFSDMHSQRHQPDPPGIIMSKVNRPG